MTLATLARRDPWYSAAPTSIALSSQSNLERFGINQ